MNHGSLSGPLTASSAFPRLRVVKPRSRFTSVGHTLDQVARRYGLEVKLLEYRLRAHWSTIVGDAIAAHTFPQQIRFKKLHLFAENSIWLQQLVFLKPALLEKINGEAGQALLTDLVMRIAPIPPPVERHPAPANAHEPSPDPASMAEATYYARAIQDSNLRDCFTAVIARQLAKTPR